MIITDWIYSYELSDGKQINVWHKDKFDRTDMEEFSCSRMHCKWFTCSRNGEDRCTLLKKLIDTDKTCWFVLNDEEVRMQVLMDEL